MAHLTENAIEQMALDELRALGWQVAFGPDIAFDGSHPERDAAANYGDVVLVGRLRDALMRINPDMPREAIGEALRRYGYPPDRQERATQLVLEQTEALCQDWAIMP